MAFIRKSRNTFYWYKSYRDKKTGEPKTMYLGKKATPEEVKLFYKKKKKRISI